MAGEMVVIRCTVSDGNLQPVAIRAGISKSLHRCLYLIQLPVGTAANFIGARELPFGDKAVKRWSAKRDPPLAPQLFDFEVLSLHLSDSRCFSATHNGVLNPLDTWGQDLLFSWPPRPTYIRTAFFRKRCPSPTLRLRS